MGFLPFIIELAAIISIAVQDYIDFAIICGMLIINACLGFHEEYKAKKSLDELSNQLESEVAVRRNGETLQLNVKELVPGDVILLVGGTSEFGYSFGYSFCSHLVVTIILYLTICLLPSLILTYKLSPPTPNGSREIPYLWTPHH